MKTALRTLDLKVKRLLEDRNIHPLAVRIATEKDVLDPFSHFNSPDGRSNEARLLDSYYKQQRSLEEKLYLNQELISLIFWFTEGAERLKSEIREQESCDTPESLGMKKILETQLAVQEQLLQYAGRSLHPSQSMEDIVAMYNDYLPPVEEDQAEDQEQDEEEELDATDNMDLLLEEIQNDEEETIADGYGDLEVF